MKSSPNKGRYLQVRVSEDQERRLRELAELNGLSVSDWVRAASLTAQVVLQNPGVAAAGFLPSERVEVRRTADMPAISRTGHQRTRG